MKKIAILAALVLAGIPAANATTALKLISGASSVTVVDNAAGDLDLTPGVIVFSGAVGNWTLNVSSGLSLGTASQPILDNLSFNSQPSSSVMTGSLEILFSETDLGPLASGNTINTAIGGNFIQAGNGTSVSYGAYYDTSNTLFGKSTLIGSVLTPTIAPVTKEFSAGQQVTSTAVSAPYSLTLDVKINAIRTTQISYDAYLSVPDGGYTLMLLGTGMTALGGLQLRRKRN